MGDKDADLLSALKTYYTMAKDENKASQIIKDQANVQYLVYLLMEDSDPKISALILKILSLLSRKPELCQELQKIYGVLQSLLAFISCCNDETLKQLAGEIHTILMNPVKAGVEVLKERQMNIFQTPRQQTRRRASCGKPRFLVSANKKANVVTIHAPGIEFQKKRMECEDVLLQVKGVISFTFDTLKKHIMIRTKPDMDQQILINALKTKAKLEPMMVAHDEEGNEILLNVSCMQACKENVELPEYLPEVDSPAKNNAVINPGYFKKTTGWINTATTFITKSFYW